MAQKTRRWALFGPEKTCCTIPITRLTKGVHKHTSSSCRNYMFVLGEGRYNGSTLTGRKRLFCLSSKDNNELKIVFIIHNPSFFQLIFTRVFSRTSVFSYSTKCHVLTCMSLLNKNYFLNNIYLIETKFHLSITSSFCINLKHFRFIFLSMTQLPYP